MQGSVAKSRARFVPKENLAGLVRHPAQLFVTAFPIEHLSRGQPDLGNPVSQLLSNRNVETVSMTGTAIVVSGFGPTLAAIGEVMSAIDVPGAVRPAPARPGEKK
jgi:hypothetical protein